MGHPVLTQYAEIKLEKKFKSQTPTSHYASFSSLPLFLFFFKSVLVRSVSRRFGNTLLQHKSADDLHVYFLSTFCPLFFCKKVRIIDYHFLENEEKWGQKENIEGKEKEKKK
jgi:hypothetical protein